MITLAKVILVQNSKLKLPERLRRREIHEYISGRLDEQNGAVDIFEKGDPVRFYKTNRGIYQEETPYLVVLNTCQIKPEHVSRFLERQLESADTLQREQYKVQSPQIVIYRGVRNQDEYSSFLDYVQSKLIEFLRANIMLIATSPTKLLRRLILELSKLNIGFKSSEM